MRIRPVIKRDIPQIIKLISDIWAEYDCILDTNIEEKYLLAPDVYFRQQDGEFWIVEEDNKIFATVAIMMLDEKTAELKSLYVHKNFRKQGLGEKLTELAINFARKKGRNKINLWSDTRFTKAHRLYERLGFERFGKRELHDLNNSVEFGFKRKMVV
ncbi:MAG: GNAT family N-acetyltransferase [Acidobacteria bacterium]|jgi:putative acetyltransferase|nr:GNAT family N-acetyltransferase [Acidobacteriota bacterium]